MDRISRIKYIVVRICLITFVHSYVCRTVSISSEDDDDSLLRELNQALETADDTDGGEEMSSDKQQQQQQNQNQVIHFQKPFCKICAHNTFKMIFAQLDFQ